VGAHSYYRKDKKRMPKYFAPSGLSTVEITGTRTGITTNLKRGKDGFFNTDSKMDGKALKDAGLVEASLMGVPVGDVGFICSGCGFNGFFAVCGKCGTNNKAQKEEDKETVECDNCECGEIK